MCTLSKSHYKLITERKRPCLKAQTVSLMKLKPDIPLSQIYYFLSSTSVKNEIIFINVHIIRGAHLQCGTNHHQKFEYKGMKTVEVTDYTKQTPSKHFGRKLSKVNTRRKGKMT